MGRPDSPPALLVSPLPGRRTLCLSVRVLHGAAHDPATMAGATHLVEHLMLRRCGGRERLQLAQQVDRLGGGVDAWTGAESMGLTVETTIDALEEATGLIEDAVLDPTFAPEDIDLERRIAIAELDLARSDPEDRVEELLLEAAWRGHPLSRPIIGDVASLGRLTPDALRRHHGALIRHGRLLVTVAGDIDAFEVTSRLTRLPLAVPPVSEPLPPLAWAGGRRSEAVGPGEQVHARLAFPTPGSGSPALAGLAVLNRILGVGASSRLFQRLREEEGLTYDVFSALVLRQPGGLLEIGWACGKEQFAQARRLVVEELDRLVSTLQAEEVEIAVEAITRGLEMDAEDPSVRVALEADERIERGRRFDLETILAELHKVTVLGVRELAAQVLDLRVAAAALCGPEGVEEQVA